MTDIDPLAALLRKAVHPTGDRQPSPGLWPRVVERIETPIVWSWADLSVAAAIAVVLLMFPEGVWLLAYHL